MDINQFLGGLDNDSHPSQQKEQTIRHSLNFTPVSEGGNLYSITNESGTELMSNITFPSGFKPIGHTILNNEIIIILCDSSGNSQVGYIVEDSSPDPTYGFYHPVAPLDVATGTVPINNNEFGFMQAHPVDCVSRKLINGHRILYFTDNNVPYGRVDLDSPPEVGSVEDEVRLTFNQKIPNINVTNIIEGAQSSIRPGIVQFITRYITQTGGETIFGIPTNPLPMVPSSKPDGANNYAGEFYEYGTINKNVELEITDVDTKFAELELIAIYYESSASIFKASIVAQIPITSNVVQYTYTGPNTEAIVKLSQEELRKIGISYTHAKCIEQKDNTLYLSNLRDGRSNYNDALQEIANKVRVKYRTQDVQFSGRGNDATTTQLAFTSISNPYITSIFTLVLPMSEDIDLATGNVSGTYELSRSGEVASSSNTIADYTQISDGDTIIINTSTGGGTLTQPTVTFTARTTPSLTNEFAIGSSNTATAANLIAAINSSTNVTDYVAVAGASADIVTLLYSTINTDANGISVTYSGPVAAVTTAAFSGANTTPTTLSSTAAVVSGSTVSISFSSPISTADSLLVLSPGFNNIDNTETFILSSTGLPVIIDAPSGGSSAGSNPGFTDYTNEVLTVTSKGYRRDEVYSLAFTLLFKDGTTTNAFHIPGYTGYVNDAAFAGGTNRFEPTGVDAWPSFSTANNSNHYVGTYVSDTVYPTKQDYPGDQTGDDISEQGPGVNTARKVRHHLMPKLENEPHYKNDGGVQYIRILSLDFEFVTPIPAFILNDVQEIVFLRERRNTGTNRSVISQGLTNNTMINADRFDNDGQVSGNAVTGGTGVYNNMKAGYMVAENIFFGGNTSLTCADTFEENGARVNAGQCYPGFTNPGKVDSGNNYNSGYRLNSEIFRDQVRYHSPETNLLTGFKFESGIIEGATLDPVLLLKGRIDKAVNFREDIQVGDSGTFQLNQNYIETFMYADFFCNYNDIDTTVAIPTPRIVNKARYLEANIKRIDSIRLNEPGLKSTTRFNQGGLEILADANLPTVPNITDFRIMNDFDRKGDGDLDTGQGLASRMIEQNSGANLKWSGADCERYLYNIKINNPNQYGQLTLASFIPIDRETAFNPGGGFRTTYTGIFGGDTFITKYAFNNGHVVPYDPFDEDGNNTINGTGRSNSARGYYNIDGIDDNGLAHGWDFRTCTYYFVESNINTYYRHRPEDEKKQDYFPNQKDLSVLLMNYFATLGNIRAYNTQYSYENNVREYFVRTSLDTSISDFENRTIYSEQAAEDDTLDAYRSFLVSDYYDLPSEKGPIWDTFVEFNTLFMHTPKALWQTFAEGQATIKGANISDAVLGTSRLFARPAQEVLETDGGYGGSISQFGGAHTQLGYIFADVLQGKIFLVGVTKTGGTILKEISKEGISTYMHKELSLGITKVGGQVDLTNITTLKSHLIDNPYMGIGIVSGYDYKLNRYLITKFPVTVQNVKQTDGFTLSYAKDIGKWFSYHSYKPNIYIPYNNRLFLTKDEEFHEMNIGNKGRYFGTVYDSELTFVVTVKGQTCSFNNIVINSISKDRTTNIKQQNDNFYEFSAHNDKSNTGPYTMLPSNTFGITVAAGQLTVKHRNNEYRIVIPRDSVIDNSADIFDITNLNNTIKFRERIKGNYIIVNLKYDNTNNFEFVLNFIKTIFTNNFR